MHIDVEFQPTEDEDELWKNALIHVYLDHKELRRLGRKAALNKSKRARTGPIECRAYWK